MAFYTCYSRRFRSSLTDPHPNYKGEYCSEYYKFANNNPKCLGYDDESNVCPCDESNLERDIECGIPVTYKDLYDIGFSEKEIPQINKFADNNRWLDSKECREKFRK